MADDKDLIETVRNVLSKDKNYMLWWLIQQAKSEWETLRERELRPHGATMTQVSVLFIIMLIGDEATPAEISRRTLREPHSVSRILDRMEKAGLIKKGNDLPQKNLVRVRITDKGRGIYRQATRMNSINRVLSVLSEEEREQLSKYLRKILVRVLEEQGTPRRVKPYPLSHL